MITAMVAAFVWTFFSGPAGQDVLRERRARRDQPRARVTYLPSAACRSNSGNGSPTSPVV